MSYRMQDLVRNSLINVVADWFDSENPLFAIYVETVSGKGRNLRHTQKVEFAAEIIEGLSPEYFVDQVVDAASEYGQRLRLRAVFLGEDGEPNYKAQPTKRFDLVPETPGTRTGSSGSEAATERLSQSLSSGFDTLVRRQEEATERQLGLIQTNAQQTERYFERLLEVQADGANTTTSQAIQLQSQISRNELLEFKIQILQESQETSLTSMMLELAPALLQSPLMASFAGLMSAAAKKWTAEADSFSNARGVAGVTGAPGATERPAIPSPIPNGSGSNNGVPK